MSVVCSRLWEKCQPVVVVFRDTWGHTLPAGGYSPERSCASGVWVRRCEAKLVGRVSGNGL